jgi:quercetin dioxygenase-like cupin family protein
MNAWTADELDKIAAAEELELAPAGRDGTLRKPVTIWVVRRDDDLYVRSVYGRTSSWFRGTQDRHEGHIRAGGVDKGRSLRRSRRRRQRRDRRRLPHEVPRLRRQLRHSHGPTASASRDDQARAALGRFLVNNSGEPMQITRNSIETMAGPSEWFTGAVYVDTVATPAEPSRLSASSVHFTPGARTAWHTHPNGQTIYVTEGVGLAQRRAGPVEVIYPGDRVFFEPGEDHWHGAAANRFMTHLAMLEVDDDGNNATWGEHVTDEEYNAAATSSSGQLV